MAIAAGFELEAAGAQPAGSLPGVGQAAFGVKAGKAESPNTPGGAPQTGRAESFKSSWQSMLESLAAAAKNMEDLAPDVEEAGAGMTSSAGGKSTPGVAHSKSEIRTEPGQGKPASSGAALQAGKISAAVSEPERLPGILDEQRMSQSGIQTAEAPHHSESSKLREGSKPRGGAQNTPEAAAANLTEPTGVAAAPNAVNSAPQEPTSLSGVRAERSADEILSRSQLTLSALATESVSSGWDVSAGVTAPQSTEFADGSTAKPQSLETQRNRVQEIGTAEIRTPSSAAAAQKDKQVTGDQRAAISSVSVSEGREASSRTSLNQSIGPLSSEQALRDSDQTPSGSVRALPTSEQAGHDAPIQPPEARVWMSAGVVEELGPEVPGGSATAMQRPQLVPDENLPTESWNARSARLAAEKPVGAANLARGTREGGTASAEANVGVSAGLQAGASILEHDPSGFHIAGSVINQGNLSNGGGNHLPGSASGSTAQQAFTVLDAESGAKPSWVHAGSHSAEAGFVDPSLGWVGVRADLSAGIVHASVLPGSAEAAQTLGGHMAGLNAYLARETSAVETVTLSTPEGRDGNAGGTMQQGTGEGAGQHDGQHNSYETSSDAQQNAGPDPIRATQESLPVRAGFDRNAMASQPGGHISVIA